MITNTTGIKGAILLTLTLIECAVKAANESHTSYEDSLKRVVQVIELLTGYTEGNQFTSDEVVREMSKYSWN